MEDVRGVEQKPFFLYSLTIPLPVEWSKYNWGFKSGKVILAIISLPYNALHSINS
jgi:hypothetical protein